MELNGAIMTYIRLSRESKPHTGYISVYFPNMYPQSQLIISLFYSVGSLHVSAPTGHPQVKHNNIIYIFMKTIYHSTSVILQLLTYMVYASYYLFIYFTIAGIYLGSIRISNATGCTPQR
jgi:hypothetical protein